MKTAVLIYSSMVVPMLTYSGLATIGSISDTEKKKKRIRKLSSKYCWDKRKTPLLEQNCVQKSGNFRQQMSDRVNKLQL